MTVAEAILSNPGLEDVNALLLEKTLTVRTLTGTDEFSAELNTMVNLATADLYAALPNQSDFSEGSLSVKYPRHFYISTAARLYRENGELEKAKSISSKVIVTGRATNKW